MHAMGCEAAPYVFHSNGGLMSVETASRFPVRTCLSGPAAGVIGAAAIGSEAGFPDLVTFDVGGTSTDVSLVKAGRPAFTAERSVAGYPVRVPMIDIQVIGAGGGSIAALDDAGALKVGPQSAGADPGPAAYGRGGGRATITDANLVLGRLNPETLLGGRLPVDLAAAGRAVAAEVAEPLGLPLEPAAEGILRIATAGMARAIRSISTERGHDLRRFALFAYGGAGPLHAADVARELGIPRIIIPAEPGTLCARGILHADLSFDLVQTHIVAARAESWPEIGDAFATLARSGTEILDRERVPERDRRTICGIDARYEGQNFEVHVAVDGLVLDGDATALDREFSERFRAVHCATYGYDIPGRAVEIVTLRLKMVGMVTKPRLAASTATGIGAASAVSQRAVYFDETTGWRETPVYDRATLPAGGEIAGPAVIEEMSATTLIHPGQSARTDRAGNLIVTLSAD
jgi:N-methylhydantoinase A